jgi:hypothetical protein
MRKKDLPKNMTKNLWDFASLTWQKLKSVAILRVANIHERPLPMITLSQHAAIRAQTRGVRDSLLNLILQHADVEAPVGSNCRLLRVHKRTAARLGVDDRLARVGVILSDTSGQIVTVLHLHTGRHGRRYRRSH